MIVSDGDVGAEETYLFNSLIDPEMGTFEDYKTIKASVEFARTSKCFTGRHSKNNAYGCLGGCVM